MKSVIVILNLHSNLNFTCNNSICSLSEPLNIINTYTNSGVNNISFRLKDVVTNKIATQNNIVTTQADGNTMNTTYSAYTNLPVFPS